MGVTIAIYNITSPNEFTLSYSSSPYGAYTNFPNPLNGGIWEPSTSRNYLEDPILIDDVTLTVMWVKLTDTVTNRYVIENILVHDYEYFNCGPLDCVLEGNIVITIPIPPTATPTATPIPPTPTPTDTPVPPTPTPIPPTPTPVPPTPTPSIYYYNATQFTCPPNCTYVSGGWVISNSSPLTPGKYYAGAGAVFLCTSETSYSAGAVGVINTPYDTCALSTCIIPTSTPSATSIPITSYTFYQANAINCINDSCSGGPESLWIYTLNSGLFNTRWYYDGQSSKSYQITSTPKTYSQYVTAGNPPAVEMGAFFGNTFYNVCTCLPTLAE
jgi:hypothetical protein